MSTLPNPVTAPEERDTDQLAKRLYIDNSRRRFLSASAGTLGGIALGGAFGTPALATDEHEDEDGDGDSGLPEIPENDFEDDVEILNYARTLELLEYRFYEEALDNISEDDLSDSEVLEEFGDAICDRVYGDLETIRDHEETHAETLGDVIEDLDGDPVDEPEFDFGSAVEEPDVFITTAVQLEDTGVSAYAGAAPYIEDDDLVAPALGIHSVEARHASFLRVLDQQIAFPDAFDDPRSRSEVLDIASQFIVD